LATFADQAGLNDIVVARDRELAFFVDDEL
jgi:hypothetical protein